MERPLVAKLPLRSLIDGYWPAIILCLAGVAAYQYTARTFLVYLGFDTPMAYLPLLFPAALVTATLKIRLYRGSADPPRDRGLDLIFGVPLLCLALLLITVVPEIWSTFYWADRYDVLSLALVAGGIVSVAAGWRWLWRLRAAMLCLFLMWPASYARALPGLIGISTRVAVSCVGWVITHLSLGLTVGPDSSLIVVHPHGGAMFQVAIASACAGANSMLGIAVLGIAVALNVDGSILRKAAWLVAGVGLAFAANLLRILSILLLAGAGQQSLALGAYHEVAGLIVFAVVVSIDLALLPVFGIGHLQPRSHLSRLANRTVRPRGRARPQAVYVLLLPLFVVFALADNGLRSYAAFSTESNASAARSFGSASSLPPGWGVVHLANYPWAQQYFGDASSLDRYSVQVDGHAVVSDVVETTDSATLNAYDVESCYLFHDYWLAATTRVDLGAGVTALVVNYQDPGSRQFWVALSWAWPVTGAGASMYERITLTTDVMRGGSAPAIADPGGTGLSAAVIRVMNQLASRSDNGVSTVYAPVDGWLVGVGRHLVAHSVLGGA